MHCPDVAHRVCLIGIFIHFEVIGSFANKTTADVTYAQPQKGSIHADEERITIKPRGTFVADKGVAHPLRYNLPRSKSSFVQTSKRRQLLSKRQSERTRGSFLRKFGRQPDATYCQACYNELTVLADVGQRGHFDPYEWHYMFATMSKPKVSHNPGNVPDHVHFDWTCLPDDFRASLANCDLMKFREIGGATDNGEVDPDDAYIGYYQWMDVFQKVDKHPHDFRVTHKELKMALLEPYREGCAERDQPRRKH